MAFKDDDKRKAYQKEYMKGYYQRNREKFLERAKAQKENDPEYQQRWRQANPDKLREYGRQDYSRRAVSARRARVMGAFVENVSHSWVFERDDGICQICQEPIGDSAWHIDHVVPLVAGGQHSYDNVQLAHAVCNVRKGSKVLG